MVQLQASLPLRTARSFGLANGVEKEITTIKDMDIEWDGGLNQCNGHGRTTQIHQHYAYQGGREATLSSRATCLFQRDRLIHAGSQSRIFIADGLTPETDPPVSRHRLYGPLWIGCSTEAIPCSIQSIFRRANVGLAL